MFVISFWSPTFLVEGIEAHYQRYQCHSMPLTKRKIIMFMPRLLKISLAAGLTIPLLAIADDPPPAGPIADISDQLENLDAKVDALQTSVDAVDAKADTIQASVDALDIKVDSVQEKVDLILGSMMVPFRTTIGGGLCDSAGAGTSNPEIDINGELSGATFVVNSILIQTSSFTELNRIFSVNSVTADGAFFQTSTSRIFDTLANDPPGDGTVAPGFDLMGLRLRESQNGGSPDEGGVFPTQIVATSEDDVDDINVRFFCRSDTTDWNIARISVAGMKQVDDVISVSYTSGN